MAEPSSHHSDWPPRFTLAPRQHRQLTHCLWLSGALTLLLWVGAYRWNSPLRLLLIAPGAALCLLSVGLWSARAISAWRRLQLLHELPATSATSATAVAAIDAAQHHRAPESASDAQATAAPLDAPLNGSASSSASAASGAKPSAWSIGWQALRLRLLRYWQHLRVLLSSEWGRALALGGPAVLLLGVIRLTWYWPVADLSGVTGIAGSKLGYLIAAAVIALAFLVLVLERYWSHHALQRAGATWPEAEPLARLARLVLLVLLVSAAAWLFASDTTLWPLRVVQLTQLLCVWVAAEFALRALLSLFAPVEDVEPMWQADSVLLALLRWPPRPIEHLQQEMQRQFGIDLRQNWAFGYIRRATLPIVALLLAMAWLLTGLHEVPLAARGIYERFGNPIAVWQPGMHVGLPWPFGRVQQIENGVVHELAAALGSDSDDASDVAQSNDEPAPPAEGPAPDSANRLWDASHKAEKSQLIASERAGQPSFEIVNMDVRFVYRIALDDAAALAATYNHLDIPTLIRTTAARQLVRTFAVRSLQGVLGEQRSELSKLLAENVQQELDAMHAGVDILAAMVEAIHPPAGAANAYHSVQAAQIQVKSMIARERGYAAEQLNGAQLQAAVARNTAEGVAREVHAAAETTEARFAAERKAYQTAGRAFLSELYLDQLSKGLANAQLVIVDHRLGTDTAGPTIDLRRFASATEGTSR